MKNKLRLLILLTPFLLFAVVLLRGNRDRTTASTRQLQAILSGCNYASLFNPRTAGNDGVTLAEQTNYQDKSAQSFAALFTLNETIEDKSVEGRAVELYVCDFSFSQGNGAMIIVCFDTSSKRLFAHIEASKMNGNYFLEAASARDLRPIFAAHDARTGTSSTR